jgi:hypothetical protein
VRSPRAEVSGVAVAAVKAEEGRQTGGDEKMENGKRVERKMVPDTLREVTA